MGFAKVLEGPPCGKSSNPSSHNFQNLASVLQGKDTPHVCFKTEKHFLIKDYLSLSQILRTKN